MPGGRRRKRPAALSARYLSGVSFRRYHPGYIQPIREVRAHVSDLAHLAHLAHRDSG